MAKLSNISQRRPRIIAVEPSELNKTAGKAVYTLDLSIVVPVYNSETYIHKTVNSLLAQTIDNTRYEIILIDDGSTDASGAIIDNLAESHRNITALHQENQGVSAARNRGIDASKGRYIAFVDSDDALEPKTLKKAVETFDAHYEEIDLLTYPMRIIEGGKTKPHVRENVLTKTGVYDLTLPENMYALVTNINVLVKNSEGLPRFDTSLEVHEDLQFMLTILLDKQKVGFSKHGAYVYEKQASSATNTKMHPYYQLENTLKFWEKFFTPFEGKKAPIYLQASFMNELNWKMQQSLLLPPSTYPSYTSALKHYSHLLGSVDDEIILNAPRVTEFQQLYFAELKEGAPLTCDLRQDRIVLYREEKALLETPGIEAQVFRTFFEDDQWHMRGFLSSFAFDFKDEPQAHYVLQRGSKSESFSLPLRPSSYDYSFCHEALSTTWAFSLAVPYKEWDSLQLFVELGGFVYPALWHFTKFSQISSTIETSVLRHGNVTIEARPSSDAIVFHRDLSLPKRLSLQLQDDRTILKNNPKGMALKAIATSGRIFQSSNPFWLYSDCVTKEPDNAYQQFLHDFGKNDGVDRYYVLHNPSNRTDLPWKTEHKPFLLDFRSPKHRMIFPYADKIITAFIELENWSPYKQKALNCISTLGRRELVYLQHGLLHAHMPWKYGAEKTATDRVVVSTPYERTILTDTYNYLPEQLIESGMPRYDFIDSSAQPKNHILFAPSWRKNLVTERPGAVPLRNNRFAASSFWHETAAFLGSPQLLTYLKEMDLHLDIKLHPYFSCYKNDFRAFENDLIHLVNSAIVHDYQLFITDYSSWTFDFVYTHCPVLYFFPDEEEFEAGLNGYSKLDLPLEEGFGPLTRTASEALSALAKFKPQEGFGEPYSERMHNFFYHYDNNQRDRLYEALMKSWSGKL